MPMEHDDPCMHVSEVILVRYELIYVYNCMTYDVM